MYREEMMEFQSEESRDRKRSSSAHYPVALAPPLQQQPAAGITQLQQQRIARSLVREPKMISFLFGRAVLIHQRRNSLCVSISMCLLLIRTVCAGEEETAFFSDGGNGSEPAGSSGCLLANACWWMSFVSRPFDLV